MPQDATSLNRAGRRAASRRARRLTALGSGVVLATSTAALLVGATPAGADITVTTLDDSGPGSLRQALADAVDGDTISLTGLSGVMTLTSGALEIEDAVSIVGPGPGTLTISGNQSSRIFTMDQTLDDGENVTISGLTLTDGDASSESQQAGGAIYFQCDKVANDLNLDNLVITGNTAPELGGGVYFDVCDPSDDNLGNFTITNSVVANNTSSASGAGGMFIDQGGTATIANTTVAGNQALGSGGGGVSAYMAHVRVLSSTVSGNTSAGNGGGIYSRADLSFLVANSTIANNTANLRDEDPGNGGGISLFSTDERSDQVVSVLQSTITGNTAASLGDGIYFEGYVGQQSVSTRAHGNNDTADAAEVGTTQFTSIAITGTIVAGNGDGSEDVATGARSSVTVDLGASVIGSVTEGVVIVDQGGNQPGITDPGLAPLAANGGPTQTMALLPGSVAIDAGPDPVPPFPGDEDDQRGPGYPRVVNGRVDVGAFEVQPAVIQPTFTG